MEDSGTFVTQGHIKSSLIQQAIIIAKSRTNSPL
jgi:hypothetical protein